MKNSAFLIIIAIISCGSVLEDTSANSKAQKVNCKNSRLYGEIEICLPEIDGMTESYSHPKVKQRSDLFNYDNNTILGLYLNKEDFAELDNFEREEVDDYFKVYALSMLEGIEIGKSEFSQLEEEYSKGNYLQKDWEEIKNKVLSKTSDLSIGKPVQIETYKPTDNIFTILLLGKLRVGSEENISAFTISMVRLKNTLIYYAYYKNYISPKTIEHVRAKNDLFGYKIIEINN